MSTIFNGKASQSVLLQDGLFLNIKDYETTYNGSSIYKIVIESGCKLPVYNGTMVNLLVTDDEYVFYNNNYGNDDAKYMSREWLVYGEERTETTISGVQVRADKDDTERRGYLVILSDGYNGTVKKDNNIGSEFATFDKIKIYLSKNGDPVALSTIFNGYADQSIWGQKGLFLSIKDYATTYNGKTIYKVVIEKDCVLPVYDGEITDWLVTDKEYVFYNKGYGADSSVNEAFGWGRKEVPETAENLGAISVSTVTYQAEEKVAEGAERGRWILIRMTENFPVNSSADVYLTFGLTDILDKIFVYTATKGENGEVTNLEIKPLGDYFKGGMTLRQFGSPADLGFCVNDQIDGTHIYAIKILKDCKIPYLTADEEYCVKTIASDVMFVNNEWGFSGEIVSTDEGGVERHYENWAINWSRACEYKFTVSGPEDVSFDSVIVKSTESIDLGAFARDGYDVSASDDNDYVYYGKIVYTGYGTANVTLTYTAKTESAGSGCSGSVGSAFGLQACFAAVAAVIIKRKRSV